MARVRTQADFIAKATDVHDGYYDYSQVVYVRTNKPIKIICPKHGVFEQTPNKHLSGQGCPECSRERMRTDVDTFVARATKVHGNKYDYSKVEYKRCDVKVCIICPEHGEFWQTPHSHVVLGQNCPKCAAIVGGQKRMGDNNPMRKESVKAKAKQTCLERYGAKTYAESDQGRERLRQIIMQPELQARSRQTCMVRYGAPVWTQSVVGRQTLHEIMSSDSIQNKIRQGYLLAYGIDHFMKTDKGRESARLYMSTPERRQAIQQAFLDKYGVPNALLIPDIQAKGWVTKRIHGTFNTSQPEESLYRLLCDKFGVGNVIRQYALDLRYPFRCDFYIPALDWFIELNASWTHGQHWFNEKNPFDVLVLQEWQNRAREKGSRFYKAAIDIWTRRDPMKLQYATENQLHYFVFWRNDLSDALAWLETI